MSVRIDELAALLAHHREQRERGVDEDRDALLARHPHLAGRLRSCLELSDLLDEVLKRYGPGGLGITTRETGPC